MIRSPRGFGVVGFLILLPFLVSALASIAAVALLAKTDARLKHECRSSVLNSQREIAQKLRDLIRLNPEAESLRNEYAEAQRALQVAIDSGQPELVPPAEAYVAFVRGRQMILKIRQQALILSARALSLAAPDKAKTAVLTSLEGETHLNDGRVSGFTARSRPGKFDVIASPQGDLTPNYEPGPRFSSSQAVDVDIRMDLGSLLPVWLRSLLPTEGLELTSHCQATLERKEDKWIETLNAVR